MKKITQKNIKMFEEFIKSNPLLNGECGTSAVPVWEDHGYMKRLMYGIDGIARFDPAKAIERQIKLRSTCASVKLPSYECPACYRNAFDLYMDFGFSKKGRYRRSHSGICIEAAGAELVRKCPHCGLDLEGLCK